MDQDSHPPGEAAEVLRRAQLVAEARAESAVLGAAEARRLRLVAKLADAATARAVAMLAQRPRGAVGPPREHEVIDSAVESEIAVVFGIGPGPAARLGWLAQRLTQVLPRVLDALEDGRLDLGRARALAEATAVLSDTQAAEVADLLLGVAGTAPWEGLSPRAWQARADRAVVKADAAAAAARRRDAYQRRAVRVLPSTEGMAEFFLLGDAADLAMAEQVLTDLANTRSSTDPDGGYVSMDQRRVDAFVDIFAKIRDGHPLPGVPVRREREVGLVLHADTFFGHGRAKDDPAEVRGLPAHTVLDPATARARAHAMARGTIGRPGAVNVFLVDPAGHLQQVVRVKGTPPGGWTRQLLTAAVKAKLDALPALRCDTYAPSVAIQQQVRARNPRCTGYDCPTAAHRCDLDHDTPWPRGPTQVDNLHPRCRRHHEHKTQRLVRTTLHPDGTVEHQIMLTRLSITTRPEPLPGHAPGEGHHQSWP